VLNIKPQDVMLWTLQKATNNGYCDISHNKKQMPCTTFFDIMQVRIAWALLGCVVASE